MKSPLLSVVMPVFNGERFLDQAIDSILNQTFKNFEFIIINDASTDDSLKIINKYRKRDKRIRIINNKKNIHMSRSINLGVSKAKTDLIARMDQDDIALPKRLEIEYKFLKSHKNVVIVGSNILTINESGLVIGKRTYKIGSENLKRTMFCYSPFAHPTVMMRKKMFEEFGGFDPKMVPCEDTDFWFRIGSKYDFASIPIFLLKYRIVVNSLSHTKVKDIEIKGFKIKLKAIREYGYRPSFYDVIYNILQFCTAWLMPSETRFKLYEFLRSTNFI